MFLNTWPDVLVFKQLPRDQANVNAWKNMCDPYINIIYATSESLKARKKIIIFQQTSLYEELKFHAQLSWAWKKSYNLSPGLNLEIITLDRQQSKT